MHGEFEEFLVIVTILPTVFVHLFAICIQGIRIVQLRVGIHKLKAFGLGKLHNLGCQNTGETSTLAKNHIPGVVVYHRPALFSLHLLHNVHQCHVLHILAERSHQRRITQLGPYIFHFVEKHHKQVVQTEFRLVPASQYHVDAGMHAFQIGHHGAHHTAWQAALQQK